MPEIAEAQALLAALAETDEVKAEAARNAQRLQLHVAYGNALIATRGYGAPGDDGSVCAGAERRRPTRTRPSACQSITDFGSAATCAASCLRCAPTPPLSSATSKPNPDAPEASVAHRAAGITHWFAGEYAEARTELEQALALFRPGSRRRSGLPVRP